MQTEISNKLQKMILWENGACSSSIRQILHLFARHKAWHDASYRIKKINYVMLADPTHALAEDFDVYIEDSGLSERGTFIVNPQGKIVAYEVSSGNVGRNAEELFRKLQACQFVHKHGDEVCPAKWRPGEETLKPSLDLVGQL